MSQPIVQTITAEQQETADADRWSVVLLDDAEHTFAYVTGLLLDVFKRSPADARALTEQVHRMGYAAVAVCSKERAELYGEQIDAYGDDPFMRVFKRTDSGPLRYRLAPDRG